MSQCIIYTTSFLQECCLHPHHKVELESLGTTLPSLRVHENIAFFQHECCNSIYCANALILLLLSFWWWRARSASQSVHSLVLSNLNNFAFCYMAWSASSHAFWLFSLLPELQVWASFHKETLHSWQAGLLREFLNLHFPSFWDFFLVMISLYERSLFLWEYQHHVPLLYKKWVIANEMLI